MAITFNHNDQVYVKDGKLGIGTDSPSAKLHVSGGEIRVDAGQAVTLDTSNNMYLVGGSNQLRLYNGGNPVVNITTGGNVGIGTTSPAQKLHVYGKIKLEEANGGTVLSGNYGYFKVSPTNNYGVLVENSGDAAKYFSFGVPGDYGQIRYKENTGSAVSVTATGVGIGTASPSSRLHVNGSSETLYLEGASSYTTAKFRYGGANKGEIVWYHTQSAFYLQNMTGGPIMFYQDGNERLRINTGGKVGIGTTSPSEKLHVSGNIKLSGVQYVEISNNASITPSAGDWIDIAQLNYGEHHGRIALEWSSLYAPSSSHHGWAEFEVGTYYSASYNYGQDTYVELVKAMAHNDFWLDAVRAVDYGSTVRIQVQAGTAVTQGTFKSYVLNKKQGTVSTIVPAINANSYTVLALANIGTVDGEEVQKAIGNHTRFSSDVAFDEKVGIGTTSPSKKLHVNGSYKLGTNAYIQYDATYPYTINIENTASAGDIKLQSANGENKILLQPSTGGIDFYTNNSERMRITDGGNVGIGTTSPSEKLHVGGNALFDGNRSVNIHSDSGYVRISAPASGGWATKYAFTQRDGTDVGGFGAYGSAGLTYYWIGNAYNTPSMVIKSSAVGIGTTTPNGQLAIKSSTNADLEFFSEASGAALQSYNRTSSTWGYLRFLAGGGEKMRIHSNGSVGIGTTGPTNAFEVKPPQVSFNLNGLADGTIALSNNSSSANSPTIAGKSLNGGQAGLQFITGTPDTNTNSDMIFSVRENDNTDFSTTSSIAYNFLRYTTSLFRIYRDGDLQLPQYGAGILKTDANGNVSLDTSTYATQTYVTDAVADLVDSAPTTLDTLNELAAALGDDANFSTTMTTALGNRLRIDTNAQGLTSTEQANGRTNLGLGTAATSASTDFVAVSGDTMTGKLVVEGNSVNWDETTQGTTTGSIHLDPVGSSTDNYGSAITFGASDSGNGATAQAGIYTRTDGSYGTKMYFSTTNNYSQGSKTRMFINANGRVGIGTTNPSTPLQVNGVITATGGNSTEWNTAYGWGDHSTEGYLTTVAFSDLTTTPTTISGYGITDAFDGDYDSLTNTPTLGTAASSAATDFVAVTGDTMTGSLTVSDSTIAISDGSTDRLTFSRETSPAVQTKIKSNNYHLTLEANGGSQGQIRFNTGTTTATEKMRILENGNVGIGTTSPSSKLHVNGTVEFTDALKFSGFAPASTQLLTVGTDGTVGTAAPYTAGSGLNLSSGEFSIESDLRDGITRVGKDNDNYIAIDADNNNSIDFYISGVWVARMEADGDLHMKGDVIAFSDIFNP